MVSYTKKFICPNCCEKDFTKVHNFSVEFRSVNFSDDILSEKKSSMGYICKSCGEMYTAEFITQYLEDIIIKYKNDEWGAE